jgi:transposase
MDWLKQHKVEVMTWPPYLSDMNPMEHLWWILKQRLVELFPDLKGNGFTVAERAHFVDCT